MILGRAQSSAHGVHAQMRRAQPTPAFGILRPLSLGHLADAQARLHSHRVWRTASRRSCLAQPIEHGAGLIVRRALWKPAIADPPGALNPRVGRGTHPDRDRALDWHWLDASLFDLVPASMEADHRLRPERPQYGDLLLHACRTIVEILAERLVLDLVPANADAQAQPAAAEHIDLSRLLGHQRSLPLRQNDHAGHKLKPLGQAGQVAEQDERLVEQGIAGVCAAPVRPVGGASTQHMIVSQQMLVAKRFSRLRIIANSDRIIADLGLRKDNTNTHWGSSKFIHNAEDPATV